MGDRDLPSDSDSNDEDYVPEGFDNGPLSEEESGQGSSDQEHSGDEVDGEKKKRKKVPRKRAKKKLKAEKVEISENEEKKEVKPEPSAEEKKKKADLLWADFLKDCDPLAKKKSTTSLNSTEKAKCAKPEEPAKVKVIEEYHFAGEKVVVEKDVTSTNGTSSPSSTVHAAEDKSSQNSTTPPSLVSSGGVGSGRLGRGGARGTGGGGGIASILGQLSKKNKLSTLQKSKLDWDLFKKDEGIKEDLERHNKGKNGYLERQDFLERADLRQFEIEKSLRAANRSSLR